MVNLVGLFGAMEIVFCNDTSAVRLKHASRVDCNSNGLLEKYFPDFIIVHFVVLHHVFILEVVLLSLLAFLSMSRIAMSVLASKHDSVLLSVLVGFVHPTTIALEVLLVTIHELSN